MTTSAMLDRVCLRRRLREIAGYLEVVTGWSDFSPQSPAQRTAVLERVTALLAELPASARLGRTAVEIDLLEGHALRLSGRYAEAVAPLRRAAFGAPQKAAPWLALAWSYKRLGRLPQAITAIKRACACEPRNPVAMYNLSCYLSLAGKKDAAIESLRTALARRPELRELLAAETDFAGLRDSPGFLALLEPACQGG
jgi:tetratricopeptide (TPR) repeat protein